MIESCKRVAAVLTKVLDGSLLNERCHMRMGRDNFSQPKAKIESQDFREDDKSGRAQA